MGLIETVLAIILCLLIATIFIGVLLAEHYRMKVMRIQFDLLDRMTRGK